MFRIFSADGIIKLKKGKYSTEFWCELFTKNNLLKWFQTLKGTSNVSIINTARP